MTVGAAHFILFVDDGARAAAFYRSVLAKEPRLDVAGMTEFALAEGAVLGLMPRAGIRRLLSDRIPEPLGQGTRSELYLVVDDLDATWARATAAGAEVIDPPALRNWGDRAGYLLDLDGNLLALASPA